MPRRQLRPALVAIVVVGAACEGDDHGDDHDHDAEIISTVELTFAPDAGGAPAVFRFTDPDGDGGMSGSADAIVLATSTSYTLDIAFRNDLVDPAEDITDEIRAEAEEHLILVSGEGVDGPASHTGAVLVTHAYADLESDYGENAVGEDLPVGLVNAVETAGAGEGALRVMLRHLPALNDEAQKEAELPAAFADGEPLPGQVDADVTFELRVE